MFTQWSTAVLLLAACCALSSPVEQSEEVDYCNLQGERLVCKGYEAEDLHLSKVTQNYEPNVLATVEHLEVKHGKTPVTRPSAFRAFRAVKQLIVHNMSITTMDIDTFKGLSHVKLIDLSHNDIQSFHISIFRATGVKHLKLDGNPHLQVPKNSPLLLANKLTWLSLRHCGIEQLSTVTFQGTPHLSHLDLSSNRLKELPEGVFDGMSLTWLDISQNNLQTLSARVFERVLGYPGLPRAVVLAGNPWHCDCTLAGVTAWLTQDVDTHFPTSDPARTRLHVHTMCASPPQLSQATWDNYKQWNCPA